MPEYGEFRSVYGVILGKDTSFLAPVNRNITDKIWYTDFAGDAKLQCADYADIAFLKTIHYYKLGDYEKSTECYLAGQRMFDGEGFKDKAYAEDGDGYSTYKIALWMIAADLARGNEEDAISKATEILGKMQAVTGGVYTHYRSGLVPDGQTNVETTALTVIAFDTSLLEPKISPPTPEQLEECKELGIEDEKCSEQAILSTKCIGMNCGDAGTTQVQVLQNPAMLAIFGLLAAGIGVATAAIYLKIKRRG
jgi:hypothetical protein